MSRLLDSRGWPLTSTAGTGGSKLFNCFTPTFIKEKNNWAHATSNKPKLFSTTSRLRLVNLDNPFHFCKYGDMGAASLEVVGVGL